MNKHDTAKFKPVALKKLPRTIAGMTLRELKKDYSDRIFKQYLPFWEKGGYDRKYGGFMCELRDDGSVENDEKFIWYQGRGIWVYSYLYNYLGRKKKYLDIALKSRDFLIKNMYLGNGQWTESVDRQGNPIASGFGQGSAKDIYGALFSAAGLIELYKANGNKDDLDMAIKSIWAAVASYEKIDYEGVTLPGIEVKGLRTQGHSFIMIWTLTNLLSFFKDQRLEELQSEHVGHIINHFWNPEFGIVNEKLYHDYSRIPGYDKVMFPGHSLEALWMVMHEAMRIRDMDLFELMKCRIRRLIEMNWDYVFSGMATEEFNVFSHEGKCQGPFFDLKVMWAHTELLIATLMIFEYTGEVWAKECYERGRQYCLRAFANTGNGVWRQGVDRFGADSERPGISIYRKDNFHQVRYQMMNLLAIERMIKSRGKINSF